MYRDDKSSEMEDAVELLREQVETLNQELHYKELELQEIEQELRYTNHELCTALNSECPTLDAAKELAENILAGEKPTRQAIAELLSIIYNSLVKADELEQIDSSTLTMPLPSKYAHLISSSEVLMTQLSVLTAQGGEVRAQARILRAQAGEVKTQSKVLKARFNELGSQFVRTKVHFSRQVFTFNRKKALAITASKEFPVIITSAKHEVDSTGEDVKASFPGIA